MGYPLGSYRHALRMKKKDRATCIGAGAGHCPPPPIKVAVAACKAAAALVVLAPRLGLARLAGVVLAGVAGVVCQRVVVLVVLVLPLRLFVL